jgi:hypothetical protein
MLKHFIVKRTKSKQKFDLMFFFGFNDATSDASSGVSAGISAGPEIVLSLVNHNGAANDLKLKK